MGMQPGLHIELLELDAWSTRRVERYEQDGVISDRTSYLQVMAALVFTTVPPDTDLACGGRVSRTDTGASLYLF
jgi:hypothetical protein